MTISELIHGLQELLHKEGDIEVEIGSVDGGGGRTDEDVRLEVNRNSYPYKVNL